MVHPLVEQLRFTRSEFQRGLKGISAEEAEANLGQMNSISWVIAHLAWQEERYFVKFASGEPVVPRLQARFGYGSPQSTPTLAEAWEIWQTVTIATDPYLDGLTEDAMLLPGPADTRKGASLVGNQLQRTICHYWYHLGETQAIRQHFGHQRLPTFVGDIDGKAPYRHE